MSGNGLELPEVLPVPQCGSACAVDLHQVLVVLLALHHLAGALPPPGVVAHQVLQEDAVPLHQLGKVLGVGLPLLPACNVSPGHGVLPVIQELFPGVVRIVVTGLHRQAITYLPAEDSHGWGHPGIWVWGVSIGE